MRRKRRVLLRESWVFSLRVSFGEFIIYYYVVYLKYIPLIMFLNIVKLINRQIMWIMLYIKLDIENSWSLLYIKANMNIYVIAQ